MLALNINELKSVARAPHLFRYASRYSFVVVVHNRTPPRQVALCIIGCIDAPLRPQLPRSWWISVDK